MTILEQEAQFRSESNFNIRELIVDRVSKETQLWLLDEDLEVISIVDEYQYFSWIHRLRKSDAFRLIINRYHPLAELMTTRKILLYQRGNKVKGGEILRRKISVDSEDGKEQENWIIDGVGYGEYLKTRIAIRDTRIGNGYDDNTDNAESLMKYYIDRNIVNPSVEARKIPYLILENDQNRGDVFKFRARFQRISDIVEELCFNSGLGWETIYDKENQEFIFKIVEGIERPEVLLSPAVGNVESIEFEESWLDFESVQFVAGQGVGSDRDIGIVTRDDFEI